MIIAGIIIAFVVILILTTLWCAIRIADISDGEENEKRYDRNK